MHTSRIRFIAVLGSVMLGALWLHSGTFATPLSSILAISAGGSHTCALTVNGGVECWGDNYSGQLGDGTTTQHRAPVDVVGLSGVAAISAGSSHTCAVTTGRDLLCWGANHSGQLGNGTRTDSPTPVLVSGLNGSVAAVAAGTSRTCAVTTLGAVFCWGDNVDGLLGAPSLDDCRFEDEIGILAEYPALSFHEPRPCSLTPVAVSGLNEGVAAVAVAGGHTCVLMATGGVKCWGYNGRGELGAPTSERCGEGRFAYPCSTVPLDVCEEVAPTGDGCSVPLSDVAGLTAGSNHNCVLTDAGAVRCWGDNVQEQLGIATDERCDPLGYGVGLPCSPTPLDVTGLGTGVSAVEAGGDHTCAITGRGTVMCWGTIDVGPFGQSSPIPEQVGSFYSTATAVSAGYAHSCAVAKDATVWCWSPSPDLPAVGAGECFYRPAGPVQVPAACPKRGDALCDGTTNSIDALLVLLFGAGLERSLPCMAAADANGDGGVNAIDATIILQIDAGLLSS